jgi:hypothetical protein
MYHQIVARPMGHRDDDMSGVLFAGGANERDDVQQKSKKQDMICTTSISTNKKRVPMTSYGNGVSSPMACRKAPTSTGSSLAAVAYSSLFLDGSMLF